LRSIAAQLGSRGGEKRAKNLTPEQRREIAKLGGQAFKEKMEKRKGGK
jgi:general stress protein YciG